MLKMHLNFKTSVNYIDKNLIPNCPVTRQDILRAEDILGPNIGSVKGKTTHTTQKHIEVHLQDIPQEIMENHGKTTLTIDIMFINKIPFIMTTSRNIHFGTVKLVKETKKNTLITSIEQVIQAYQTQQLHGTKDIWSYSPKAIRE